MQCISNFLYTEWIYGCSCSDPENIYIKVQGIFYLFAGSHFHCCWQAG